MFGRRERFDRSFWTLSLWVFQVWQIGLMPGFAPGWPQRLDLLLDSELLFRILLIHGFRKNLQKHQSISFCKNTLMDLPQTEITVVRLRTNKSSVLKTNVRLFLQIHMQRLPYSMRLNCRPWCLVNMSCFVVFVVNLLVMGGLRLHSQIHWKRCLHCLFVLRYR